MQTEKCWKLKSIKSNQKSFKWLHQRRKFDVQDQNKCNRDKEYEKRRTKIDRRKIRESFFLFFNRERMGQVWKSVKSRMREESNGVRKSARNGDKEKKRKKEAHESIIHAQWIHNEPLCSVNSSSHNDYRYVICVFRYPRLTFPNERYYLIIYTIKYVHDEKCFGESSNSLLHSFPFYPPLPPCRPISFIHFCHCISFWLFFLPLEALPSFPTVVLLFQASTVLYEFQWFNRQISASNFFARCMHFRVVVSHSVSFSHTKFENESWKHWRFFKYTQFPYHGMSSGFYNFFCQWFEILFSHKQDSSSHYSWDAFRLKRCFK